MRNNYTDFCFKNKPASIGVQVFFLFVYCETVHNGRPFLWAPFIRLNTAFNSPAQLTEIDLTLPVKRTVALYRFQRASGLTRDES